MPGTTHCPFCKTRFKIAEEQLETHLGMVRCGHCLQTFDARPGFVPDQPSPQLELPMMDAELPILDAQVSTTSFGLPVLQPMTLAEQVAIVEDEGIGEYQPKYRSWPWAIAALSLTMLLVAQSAYFFRVELAARIPGLKPALVGYCRILKCTVPLPQKTGLITIESSELEADPKHENQINLNALLRNRAPYSQTFPSLELTLNDSQDKPLARRLFRPAEYLPPQENEAAGMLPNHELNLRLHLNIGDLRPVGYRLAVFYPGT
ncbi:MAG: hypothetical protein A3H31_09120 [Gallionellales bacterium RIFCSPLOWO2_02_FULL_57_47]|nr:MAG: hypothetical protein A3H31_09120 [Gallionellales bacterium RIFCSPLOWO2_02_FULL_57_47]OGT08732.1 MAG: hypothetical protein A3J49_18540 [Gallionellales bacterium RIFCSPHIGHO2_02_FULL_57_16]